MVNGTSTRVYVGAAGGALAGIYRRTAAGEPWEPLRKGLPQPAQVHAITVHPSEGDLIYLGAEEGLFRSRDGGQRWEPLPFPDGTPRVWSVLVHPTKPRTLYAGTSPVGVYTSDDGGETWRRLTNAGRPDPVRMSFACRVMRLAVDPGCPDDIYACLEVGGVMRSGDGGETWQDCSAGLLELAKLPHLKSRIQSDTDTEGMLDGHALCVSAAEPGTVILAVRMGLFRSADRGATWTDMEVGRFSPLTYARDIRVAPQEPCRLYACLSPAARSQDGALYLSEDLGRTWTRFDRGVEADSTMMAVALHPEDPRQVYAVTRSGQLFGTQDGGRTWREDRLPPGVDDVYAVACA